MLSNDREKYTKKVTVFVTKVTIFVTKYSINN